MSGKLLFSILRKVEETAALLRGKGYGTASVDREVEAALRLLGRPPELVLDIGANRGIYAAAIRQRAPQAEIHLFEPSGVCCSELRERFAEDERVFIEQIALSDEPGSATLYADRAGSGLASLTQRKLEHIGIQMDLAEPVQTARLEDYWTAHLDGRRVDVAKIDVEGHELSVLRGFGPALPLTSVIQFEFGGTQIDTQRYFKDYYSLLAGAGFRLYRISPVGLEPIERYSERDETFLTTNYIATQCRV